MRFWGKNICIDGSWIQNSPSRNDENLNRNPNAEQFEIDTQNVLRKIEANKVGKCLITALGGAPRKATIRPLSDQAQRKMSSTPVFDKDASNHIGSDVNIWFNHHITAGGGHFQADDCLFHESVHALRQARGRFSSISMAGWDNRDEFYAILLTNIYLSSTGRNEDLREGHGSATAPFKLLTLTEDAFYRQYLDEILDFRVEMGEIADPVSMIPTGWNPLRVAERWRMAW
jgi:hypothetical protein